MNLTYQSLEQRLLLQCHKCRVKFCLNPCVRAGLVQEIGSLLQGAARAPLPGLPGAPAGASLGGLLESVANTTGLLNATETVMQRAQTGVASGNFTQVRHCIIRMHLHKFGHKLHILPVSYCRLLIEGLHLATPCAVLLRTYLHGTPDCDALIVTYRPIEQRRTSHRTLDR